MIAQTQSCGQGSVDLDLGTLAVTSVTNINTAASSSLVSPMLLLSYIGKSISLH